MAGDPREAAPRMHRPTSLPVPRSARAALAVLAVVASACGGDPAAPAERLRPAPAEPPLAAITCTARPAQAVVSCADAADAAGGVRASRILGGQGVSVRLTSTDLRFDAAAGLLEATVTVQNLTGERIGTPDGTRPTGVRVFFHSAPATTDGSGGVEVEGEDGRRIFTGSDQPFYHYPQALAPGEVSNGRRWRWRVPPSVGAFTFEVLVEAETVPALVFEAVDGGNRDLWRVSLHGGDLARLTTSTSDDTYPTVGGGRVVFTSYRTGNAELFSVPLAGGAETRLTTTPAKEIQPALSRDGRMLAFARDGGGFFRLWAGADAGSAARLTGSYGDGPPIEGSPAWAPDGLRVAFMSTAGGTADLWAASAGGTPSLLAGGPHAEVEPAWSPDGKRVAFVSNRDGDDEIYLLTLATGAVERLTERAGSDAQPAWLRDGRLAWLARDGAAAEVRWMHPDAPRAAHVVPVGALRPLRLAAGR